MSRWEDECTAKRIRDGWESIKAHVKETLGMSPISYETWIAPLKLDIYSKGVALIRIPREQEECLDYIREKLGSCLGEMIRDYLNFNELRKILGEDEIRRNPEWAEYMTGFVPNEIRVTFVLDDEDEYGVEGKEYMKLLDVNIPILRIGERRIPGVRVRVLDDTSKTIRKIDKMTILPAHHDGLNALYHIRLALRDSDDDCITRSFLNRFRKDLLIGSARFGGEVAFAVLENRLNAETSKRLSYYDFAELCPQAYAGLLQEIVDRENREIYSYCKQMGMVPIASIDQETIDYISVGKEATFDKVDFREQFHYFDDKIWHEIAIKNPKKLPTLAGS